METGKKAGKSEKEAVNREKTAGNDPKARTEPTGDASSVAGNDKEPRRWSAAEDIRRLNDVVARAVRGFRPPEDLTVSQWADKYRRLSPESSAEPGPWRTSRTPYLQEPMDAFTDPKVRELIMVSSSQIGKSEFENNILGYIIHQDPGSVLFVHPTTIDAKDYSKLRVAPMIRDCKPLRERVAEAKSRDSGNTILQKTYPGGILTMCGSTEAHALASKPIRYIIGDERDRWETSAGKEGDPWELGRARQITFYNAKAAQVSTPTIKNASAIEKAFNRGTMERCCTQCPHCGEYHNIIWDNIRFDHTVKTVAGAKVYEVTAIRYICPECGAISTEAEMRKQPFKWIAENLDAYKKGVRSFWLNAFVSPWATWESIILLFLESKDDPRKLQVVYNTRFGELWEDRGDLADEGELMRRREDYGAQADGNPVELPDSVLVLICGVDTQDDRLEYEVVGYGHFGESWGIRKGVILGRPDDPEVWKGLDDVINHVYLFRDGLGLRPAVTFIDDGGHYSQEVRLRCRDRLARKVFDIKGRGGESVPYTAPPKKVKIVIKKQIVGECWQYILGVDAGKQMIMDNLRVQTPGANYCHFPLHEAAGYDSEYFKGLLSERLTYKPERKNPWVWEKIPGHERNEALDCRNYNLAAFKALNPDMDVLARRMLAARAKRKGQPVAAPGAGRSSPKVEAKVSAQVKKTAESAAEKYYDDW